MALGYSEDHFSKSLRILRSNEGVSDAQHRSWHSVEAIPSVLFSTDSEEGSITGLRLRSMAQSSHVLPQRS